MNIHNFETHINKTILDRGFNYYMDGRVVESYGLGDDKYVFYIEGSDDYEVTVEVGENGDILYSECNCPYDFGPVCKHEAAAYFQLVEILNQMTSNGKVNGKPSRRSSLPEVLSALSKDELLEIIIDIVNDDEALENSLIVKYSNSGQELESCQQLINAIVRKYKGRNGFINYRDIGAFTSEMESVAEKARTTQNPLLAVDIALLLLGEAINAFQYADDSGGDIGSLVMETLELITEIAAIQSVKAHQRTEVFEKLLSFSDHPIFDGWEDFRMDLLEICLEFADDAIHREQLRRIMESMLDEESSDRYTNYKNERILQLLFQLIEQYGTQEEAEQFIHGHLQFSSFREELINQCIQKKNYHKVIELALEGEMQDEPYRGLIAKWKKFRYIAYKCLALKEEQQKLAKELLFDGEFEYYQDLKELTSEYQCDFYLCLKQELKSGKGWDARRIFLKVIETENDLEEMLEFVKDNPSYIEEYAEKLVKPFKEEVIELYKKYIESIARDSSNRREYRIICQKIKRYTKIAGKTKQEELINQLKDLYRKRPAFIDELGKMK